MKRLATLLGGLGLGLLAVGTTPAQAACGPTMFIAGVCWTGANFCPRNFVVAQGQLLAIAKYASLFSLIGTKFGGDGRTTFGVPDMRNRSAVGTGSGGAFTEVKIGQKIGAETVTLTEANLPVHSHGVELKLEFTTQLAASSATGDHANAAGAYPASRPTTGGPPTRRMIYNNSASTTGVMAADMAEYKTDPTQIQTTKAGEEPDQTNAFNARPPQVTLMACIATQGLYPDRPN